MQVILCATYLEARPLIERLEMAEVTDQAGFRWRVFKSEGGAAGEERLLFITGVGGQKAAECCEFVCRVFGRKIQIVNAGTCASVDVGQVFLGSKVVCQESGRSLYPDLLVPSFYGCAVREIVTCDHVAAPDLVAARPDSCFDMEAYYIFETAMKFLGPHMIAFVKVGSDCGISDADFSSAKNTTESDFMKVAAHKSATESQTLAIKRALDEIIALIDLLKQQADDVLSANCADFISLENTANNRLCKDVSDCNFGLDFDRLAQDLRCSTFMKNRLKKQLNYAKILGLNIPEIVAHATKNLELPLEHKKTGITVLDKIDELIFAQ